MLPYFRRTRGRGARVSIFAFGATCVSSCLLPHLTRICAGQLFMACSWSFMPSNTKMFPSLRQRHDHFQMWAPVDQLLVVLMNMLSRKNEFQADAYAVKLGYAKGLQTGLVKLQLENLGNMVRQMLQKHLFFCCTSSDLGYIPLLSSLQWLNRVRNRAAMFACPFLAFFCSREPAGSSRSCSRIL